MKTNGLNVDAAKIGGGLYQIICNKGEEAIVAFGMIPVWILDSLRPMLRDKVVSEICTQYGITRQELDLMGILDEAKVKSIVAEIEKAVCVEIYRAASEANAMAV